MWLGLGETRNAYKIFVKKLPGKRPLERLNKKWKVDGTG
jgi:hypothetical protein